VAELTVEASEPEPETTAEVVKGFAPDPERVPVEMEAPPAPPAVAVVVDSAVVLAVVVETETDFEEAPVAPAAGQEVAAIQIRHRKKDEKSMKYSPATRLEL
jgi:hypothetical protein